MQRRRFTNATLAAAAGVLLAGSSRAAGVSEADAASGIRAALDRGAGSAVDLLGRKDGFLANPKVRIPLPGYLKDASKLAKLTGQQKQVDDLVTAMNRAAEAAVPEARPLLVSAVKSMSVDDAKKIVSGGDDSVTKFFASKTRRPLGEKFLPIVTRETEKVGLAAQYNALAGKGAGMGLVKGDQTSVERYVTGKALDGLYLMIGEEEKKIRRDPVGTGSALLAKVFGK
jgi:Protein of unknown function (DUF4197)